jgi:hypothetical protein
MKPEDKKNFLNTLMWGLILWLFGYVLGFVFFAFVPVDMIGWYIMPLGTIVTLWVLVKKIKRPELMCYIGLGVIWTVMAVVLDYIFVIKVLSPEGYYKPSVYVYYILTLLFPIIVGYFKMKKSRPSTPTSTL